MANLRERFTQTHHFMWCFRKPKDLKENIQTDKSTRGKSKIIFFLNWWKVISEGWFDQWSSIKICLFLPFLNFLFWRLGILSHNGLINGPIRNTRLSHKFPGKVSYFCHLNISRCRINCLTKWCVTHADIIKMILRICNGRLNLSVPTSISMSRNI